jgi:anthranilate phosphoribosyltransferase
VAQSLEDLGGWPGVLRRLAAGQDLTAEEAEITLTDALNGAARPSQLAAFIFGLRCKGETTAELTGLVRAMLDAAEPVDVSAELRANLVDTCGTGGDHRGTINVSTISAFVIAGAGVPVCKHANRSSSSLTGSIDVLEALGVQINLGPAGVATCLAQLGLAFCFAQRFHPSMRHLGPIRAELGVPTAFNYLGPLANPLLVTRQVVGVSDPAMAASMRAVLEANGATRVLVVHGHDGLDELSTTGPSTVYELTASPAGEAVRSVWTLDPAELGLAPATLADIRGGDVAANAAIARRVLDGETGAHRDIVVLNAAAGLLVSGTVEDLAEGITRAAESIDTGSALRAFDGLVELTSSLAPGE